MLLVKMQKSKEGLKTVYRARLAQTILILRQDKDGDLSLYLEPDDQPGLFTHPGPGEKGWLDDQF